MTRLLETVRDFSLLSGLQVNIDKCAGFHVQPFRRTWLINSRDPWKMSGKNIPALKPGDTSQYLGANIDPWTGCRKSDWEKTLENWCLKIDKYPLKPRQKIDMMKTYALARLRFDMTLNLSSMGEVKAVDRTVLRWTKRWLNLHLSATNGIFYTVKQRGGLGIPKLAVEIPIARVEALRKSTKTTSYAR